MKHEYRIYLNDENVMHKVILDKLHESAGENSKDEKKIIIQALYNYYTSENDLKDYIRSLYEDLVKRLGGAEVLSPVSPARESKVETSDAAIEEQEEQKEEEEEFSSGVREFMAAFNVR